MNILFFKKVIGPILFFLIALVSYSQEIKKDSTKVNELDEVRSEEHTSELQSHHDIVCRLLLEKKKNQTEID